MKQQPITINSSANPPPNVLNSSVLRGVQLGFFDLENRSAGLDAYGDPLAAINRAVPFEMFRMKLKTALIQGG